MSFNWNNVAWEMSPMAPYIDLYSSQPRIYMFEGAGLIDVGLLGLATILSVFWLLILLRANPSPTKSLFMITATQIAINCLVRCIKAVILLFIAYPTFSSLFVTSSVETTFHYTLYLQYTSSILVFIWIREKDFAHSYTNLYYIPSLFFALFISVLNVNFNALLLSIPFYIYVLFYVGMSISNIFILVTVVASCLKIQKSKTFLRLRLFVFLLVACPPILFNTIITIMDLLFMVVGVSEEFPIPYIVMTTYRYKAFEVTPITILLAFFALFPDLRKRRADTPITVITPAETNSTPSQTSTTSPQPSNNPPNSTLPTLPGELNPQGVVSSADTVPYLPNYSGYSTGGLVVHIQPLN